MTPDLLYLSCAALLNAFLFIPYVVGLGLTSAQQGISPLRTFRDPTPPELPAWVKRTNRAHMNSVETLAPIAILLLVAHVTGISNEMTAMWALVFLCARIAHALVYWMAIPIARTLAFFAGLIATGGVFWEIVFAVPTP